MSREKLTTASANTNRDILLMTHIVIGYPDLKASRELVETMVSSGVDLIELQIPFSDPLADGPVITQANTEAVAAGVTTADAFSFAAALSRDPKLAEIPYIFVVYFNTILRMGVEEFCRQTAAAGVSGIICPDYNIDHEAREQLLHFCKKHGIAFVPLVTPVTTEKRLKEIAAISDSIVYCTARLGITGAMTDISEQLTSYLRKVGAEITAPKAVGFGIREPQQIEMLAASKLAKIAVVGSAVLTAFKEGGSSGVQSLLTSLRSAV